MASYTKNQPKETALGFNAEVINSKPLIDTITGIHNGKPDQHTLFTVDEDGITFKVHDLGNNIQGLATLNSNLFHEFVLDQGLDVMEFKINVAALLKCLNIYGQSSITQTCTSMEYDEESPDFRLVLRINSGSSSNISTQCRIKTLAESEETFNDQSDLFTALRDSETVGQAIIFSDSLSDAFCEIYSLPGAATVSLLISPVAPFFQLSAEGTTGKCTIEFPKGSESFKNFVCERTICHHYQLSLIQDALKVLPSSHQTNIQMSSNGLLCFQHRLQHKSGDVSYVEFVILPDDNDDDNDNDGGGEEGEAHVLQKKKRRRNERVDEKQAMNASELFDDDEEEEEEEEEEVDPYKYVDNDQEQQDVGIARREKNIRRRREREEEKEEEEDGTSESDHEVIGPSGDEMDESDDDEEDTQVEE